MTTLEAQVRNETKKNKVKKLRSEGLIPAVVYGLNKDSISLTLNRSEVLKAYKNDFGTNTIIELNITDGNNTSKETVLTYGLEVDAITNSIKHIDFIRLDDNVKVKTTIPIELTGSAPGLKRGGVLVKKTDVLKVKCLPKNILKTIQVDLSEQQVGDFIRVKDIQVDNIEILTSPDDTIVRIAAPRNQAQDGSEESDDAGESNADENNA